MDELDLLLSTDVASAQRMLTALGYVVDSEGDFSRGGWWCGRVAENFLVDDGDLPLGQFETYLLFRWRSDGVHEADAKEMFEAARAAGIPALLVEELDRKVAEFRPAAHAA